MTQESFTLVEESVPGLQDGARCEICGKIGAHWVADPYSEDVYGEIRMQWMCHKCIQDSCDDI